MYIKIKDDVIVSYSRDEIEGGIYTTTMGLRGGMIVENINGEEVVARKSDEQLQFEKEKELTDMQGKMMELNKNRRDLQDLIDFGLNTAQDIVARDDILKELTELAQTRKKYIDNQ